MLCRCIICGPCYGFIFVETLICMNYSKFTAFVLNLLRFKIMDSNGLWNYIFYLQTRLSLRCSHWNRLRWKMFSVFDPNFVKIVKTSKFMIVHYSIAPWLYPSWMKEMPKAVKEIFHKPKNRKFNELRGTKRRCYNFITQTLSSALSLSLHFCVLYEMVRKYLVKASSNI